jgi:hypothetical protein
MSSGFTASSLLPALWLHILGAVMAVLLAQCVVVGRADADPAQNLGLLPQSALHEALTAPGTEPSESLTDPGAAQELPHRDLDRDQVLALLQGVFGSALQGPAGEFDSLDVQKFLSNTAALVLPVEREVAGVSTGGEAEGGHSSEPVLLESTVPLRVEGPYGLPQAIDLSLEQASGQVQSAAPLVPVAIPQELGDGIELPDAGVQIELQGAPEDRAPSIIEESVAAYPNIDTDTDFAVAPTPTGVETLTTLRSPDAPHSQTFALDVPSGANLTETDHGAEVIEGGETLLAIKEPTAIDASGNSVPVAMQVTGDSITITASPGPDTAWPVLVDPLYESYDWQAHANTNTNGWTEINNTTSPRIVASYFSGLLWNAQHAGLFLGTPGGTYFNGAQAAWVHGVPHLFEMWANNEFPASYITSFNAWGVGLETNAADAPGDPYFFSGIFDPATAAWAGTPGNQAIWTYMGNATRFENASLAFTSGTPGAYDKKAQLAYGIGLAVTPAGWVSGNHQAFLGASSTQVADEERPSVSNVASPQKWVNATATEPITFNATDRGLGVKWTTFAGLPKEVVNILPCTGVAHDPCPTTTKATLATSQYNPATMPQGINYLTLSAGDVLGNEVSPAAFGKAQVKVDHTAPGLSLSGTMTEQASLGTTLPQYTLKYAATDGTEAAPQSGVVSTEVKVDGKAVEAKYAPGCATKNCSITKEWTLLASQYTTGAHTVGVVTTDGVGLTTTKTVAVTLGKDSTAPQLKATGALYSAPEGWVEQKSYAVTASAPDVGGYGTTSLVLKIDGATVKSATGSCPEGGCGKSILASLNMASYDGGEHPAELIATDGAGNVAKKVWTINVDPSGAVTTGEATDTLEAMEETEPEVEVVLPTDEAISEEERAAGNDPSLQSAGGQIVSAGIPVDVSISSGVDRTVTVAGAETELEVSPMAHVYAEPEVVEDVAAVSAAASGATDSVVRPKYDGFTAFQAIREATAPETYSWEVGMESGQTLKLAEDGQSASVYFEDGTTSAMLISAEPAHDAVGHAVPTHLSVSGGNIVTLTVEHHISTYVYPVLAGPAFEVGYVTVEAVIPPPPEPEGEGDYGPWEAYNPVQQTNPLTRLPMSIRKANRVEFSSPAPISVIGGARMHHRVVAKYFSRSNEDNWWIELYGWFWTNNTSAWRDEESISRCVSDSNPVIYHNVRKIAWAGESPVYESKGKHMLLWCTADIIFLYPEGESDTRWKVSLLMWPNGYWRPEIKEVEECFTADGHKICGPVLT